MNKQLTVTIKNVYGNEAVYPACEQSELFARIAGTKTLTESCIRELKKAGYSFVVSSKVI